MLKTRKIEGEEGYEFCVALDILFCAIEKCCNEAGLKVFIDYTCNQSGKRSMNWWLGNDLLSICGGEIALCEGVRGSSYNRFLKWAQIEGAGSVGELTEGLVDDNISIREKAMRKKEELTDDGGD